MTPKSRKRTIDDNEAVQTNMRNKITRKRGLRKRRNMFYSVAEETTGEILSFLTVKEISSFRVTSKYLHQTSKMSYTEEHCGHIVDNLERIYSSGGIEAVRNMLLGDVLMNPSARSNGAIGWASRCGHLCLVKELLKDARVDPSACDNFAIREASANGHLRVVRELLKDSRVDPSDRDNCAICVATAGGYLDVVRELLKDDRVCYTLGIRKGLIRGWRSDKDFDHRLEMVGKIIQTLQKRKPNTPQEWSCRFPGMSTRLEKWLYLSAASFEAYNDFSTLTQRLQQFIMGKK
eukprot:CAMPEP_0172484496 /NCGR_PEP_ID=MMETSP1066-20121228/11992_1 /TAXON_ID=671091 /ORGANISM="Coscinodiscus wailesii, Strain CCMP2513" /LENGTH=290 /DNA_ID=CAMNT_0013249079 /DNA_START=66 /DNA_END=938 /DNA_ORIENTATION=+